MTRTERQLEVLKRWKEANYRAGAVCCTGFGKTRIGLTAIDKVSEKNPNIKVVVVVPTKVLKEQWEEQLKNKSVNVKVLVINTAARKKFDCDFLIVDEVHRAASETNRKIFTNCNPVFILGLTATYERLDGKEKEVLDKYCPVCDTVSLEEATKNGWVSVYNEYKVLLDVDLTEYEKANKLFINHFSFFDFDFKLALDCVSDVRVQQKLSKKLNCELKEVKAHAYAWNRALQFRKSFIANHPKKIEIAEKILNARKECKAITFNTSIKQCNAYHFGKCIHSGKDKKENKEILEEFNKCENGVIHSAKSLLEGVDVQGLNLAIVAGFNSSQINKKQASGRVLRFAPNKRAEIFTLVIKGTVEEKWLEKAGEGMSYIELNEEELDLVLDNKELNKTVKNYKPYKNMFRY